jgi:hypothetical protein
MKNLFKFHNSTILSVSIVLIVMTLFMLSCQREDVKPKSSENSGAIENRTAEPCEPNDLTNCEKDTQFWVIKIPQFGNCDFLFGVERYKCNGSWTYNFGNHFLISHDCDSFDIWINNCTASGSTFESCILNLQDEIRKALTLKIVNTENPSSPQVTLSYFEAACNQYCLYEMYDPRLEKYFNLYHRLRCSNACCEHEIVLAKVNGEWVYVSSSSDQYGGVGCEYILQVETCEDGAIYTSPCIDSCE